MMMVEDVGEGVVKNCWIFDDVINELPLSSQSTTQIECSKGGHGACVTAFESDFVGRSTEN